MDNVGNKSVTLGGTPIGLANKVKAQVIERREGHPDYGKVVFETDFGPNLILDAGMDRVATTYFANLFTHCAIGDGTTPVEDSSGAVTATTSGTTCTASAAIFTVGDAGKLFRFATGEKAMITAYIDDTRVTLAEELGVSSWETFRMFRVSQVGLDNEIRRSGTYLTGAGNCGYEDIGGTRKYQTTYEFPAEETNTTYNEVGFSHTGTPGANLNTRALLVGAPVTVVAGQQIRIVYFFSVTVGPITPVNREWNISGWPAKQYPVAVDTSTDRISLTGHGFPAGTKIQFQGVTPPDPITFGTAYYVVDTMADSFKVEASVGGGAIDITTAGSEVVVLTNTKGKERLLAHGLTELLTNRTVSVGSSWAIQEPASTKECFVSTSTDDFPSFPAVVTYPQVPTGGVATLTPASYSTGSFTRVWSVTFPTSSANSSSINRIVIGRTVGYQDSAGLMYKFNHPQEKSSLYMLTINYRMSWDRDFS